MTDRKNLKTHFKALPSLFGIQASCLAARLKFGIGCAFSRKTNQIFNSSENRLARILLMLAHRNGSKDGNGKLLFPGMIQDNLAQMVGTTRSRINFFMNKFRKKGLISYNGGLTAHRNPLLAVLHD